MTAIIRAFDSFAIGWAGIRLTVRAFPTPAHPERVEGSGAALSPIPPACPPTRQLRDQFPVPRDQCLLLGATPALEFALGGKGLVAGREAVGPDQHHRPVPGGVAAERTGLVLGEALVEVVGVASVVAAVGATQEVGKEGHRFGLALA